MSPLLTRVERARPCYRATVRPLLFRWRQLAYDLGSSLFARPAAWILGLASLALVLPRVEARWFPALSALLATEPGSAQVVLGTLASSTMSVVSVVYSILLVALSLASMQFSTRILAGMMRNRASQHTLGLFAGTFVYCLILLRSVHADPVPFVPGVALTGAIALALVSLGGLVWFIHNVVNGIQANHLVDRIAEETEAVIDEVFPEPLPAGEIPVVPTVPPVPDCVPVLADRSGYVQLIDLAALVGVAGDERRIHLTRQMGAFVAKGLPLAIVSPACPPEDLERCRRAVDIGPVRTMQRDAEFGVRQIVDIALKAISPAVNDPSTANTCIDHLGRLLVRIAGRRPMPTVVGNVVVPAANLPDLLDLAIEQLRQYGRADMAVALRLLRVLGEVASVTRDAATLQRIETHARLLEASVRAAFPAEDCDELARRRDAVRRYTLGAA
jgi:uncharacterized membrane protein